MLRPRPPGWLIRFVVSAAEGGTLNGLLVWYGRILLRQPGDPATPTPQGAVIS